MTDRERLSLARQKFIDKAERKFDERLTQAQYKLLNKIFDEYIAELDTSGGNLVPSQGNYTSLSLLDVLWERFTSTLMSDIARPYIDDAKEVFGLNADYFTTVVSDPSRPYEDILSEVFERLFLDLLGYNDQEDEFIEGSNLERVVTDPAPINEVKNQLASYMSSGLPIRDVRSNLSQVITGENEQGDLLSRGLIERQFDFSLPQPMQTFDRQAHVLTAQELGISKFVYQGGLVPDSREFCVVRNRKAFTYLEILKFGTNRDEYGGYTNKEKGLWQGKCPKVGYNPFLHLGGCNCRHSLDGISDELYDVLKKREEQSSEAPAESLVSDEEARELAERKLQDARDVWGADASDLMQKLNDKYPDAELTGFDFRFKSVESTIRKIHKESAENGWDVNEVEAKDLNDLTRFTFLIDSESYTQTMVQIMTEIENEGYGLFKFKNTWDTNTYRGVNTNFINRDGKVFELQFHTPESWLAKEGYRDGEKVEGFLPSHHYYEIARDLSVSEEDRAEALRQMALLWEGVPQPDGITEIPTRTFTREQAQKRQAVLARYIGDEADRTRAVVPKDAPDVGPRKFPIYTIASENEIEEFRRNGVPLEGRIFFADPLKALNAGVIEQTDRLVAIEYEPDEVNLPDGAIRTFKREWAIGKRRVLEEYAPVALKFDGTDLPVLATNEFFLTKSESKYAVDQVEVIKTYPVLLPYKFEEDRPKLLEKWTAQLEEYNELVEAVNEARERYEEENARLIAIAEKVNAPGFDVDAGKALIEQSAKMTEISNELDRLSNRLRFFGENELGIRDELLGNRKGDAISYFPGGANTDDFNDKIDRALEFYGRLFGEGHLSPTAPTVSINRNDFLRGGFNPARYSINAPNVQATITHELGHYMEVVNPGYFEQIVDFIDRRYEWDISDPDELRSLTELYKEQRDQIAENYPEDPETPLREYGDDEVGWEMPEFPQPYFGKSYSVIGPTGPRGLKRWNYTSLLLSEGVHTYKNQYSSEISAMALEMMYTNPFQLYRIDPELFRFMWRLTQQ